MQRNEKPVYIQVRDKLWQQIEDKAMGGQERLPSERELASLFSTTRVTLRQALGQLEAEGKIFRSNRRGWYVTPERLHYDPSQDIGFYNFAREQGYTPSTETLSKQLIEMPEKLAEVSGLAEGSPIYHIVRRRSIDNRTVVVEHNYVNPVRCPGLLADDTDHSLWQLLEQKYGLAPHKRQIEIYPQALTGLEAEALNVNSGSAGLFIQRLAHDDKDQFLELDYEYWLHDALKVTVKAGY